MRKKEIPKNLRKFFKPIGLKPKDDAMIPARVALALQRDGWYLRSTMSWIKKNAMPSSVRDRPTTAHEYVFLLAKSKRYFWDAEAVRIPHKQASLMRYEYGHNSFAKGQFVGSPVDERHQSGKQLEKMEDSVRPSGRSYRTTDPWFASLDERIEQQRAYLAQQEHHHTERLLRLLLKQHVSNDEHPGYCAAIVALGKKANMITDDGEIEELMEYLMNTEPRPSETESYLAHLEHIKANGGLLLDEDGDPLALQVNTTGFSGAHFAVFPPDLVLPFVRAGSSERGVCPECGGPWERVVERKSAPPEVMTKRTQPDDGFVRGGARVGGVHHGAGQKLQNWRDANPSKTLGWQPTCSCNAGDPIPATILDPFAGAGTTLMVADREQRDAIGIELSLEYANMAHDRIRADGGMFTQVTVE